MTEDWNQSITMATSATAAAAYVQNANNEEYFYKQKPALNTQKALKSAGNDSSVGGSA